VTSRHQLMGWFERGVSRKAAYMLICDTFKVGHFPIYVDHSSALRAIINRYNDTPMTRVVEVYDLNAAMEEQLLETVTWRMPPVINVQLPTVFQARRSQERRQIHVTVLYDRRLHRERRNQEL
jgi:hypothetical protein